MVIGIIVLNLIVFIGFLFSCLNFKNNEKEIIFLVVLIALIALNGLCIYAGYETGQIDALSGQKIQYKLVEMKNGETVWKHIDFLNEEDK